MYPSILSNDFMKIVFVGGGTAGSVTPLLALSENIDEKISMLWIGTMEGPERKLIEPAGIPFKHIFCGKLRRYFDWRNFIDPFFILIGFFQALFLLRRFKPNVVIGAGSFVQVPVIWATWALRIPSVIHQLDMKVGLANRLCAGIASRITVSWPELIEKFSEAGKVFYTGTPIRGDILEAKEKDADSLFQFGLNSEKPVTLIMGGGRGSAMMNELIWSCLDELLEFTQIIHATGLTKSQNHETAKSRKGYFQSELLINNISDAYRAADLVISRAGMGTLAELAALGKPSIIIPLETGNTQQLKNAEYFAEKNAIYMLREKNLFVNGKPSRDGVLYFIESIKSLLIDCDRSMTLAKNIKLVDNSNVIEKFNKIIKYLAVFS